VVDGPYHIATTEHLTELLRGQTIQTRDLLPVLARAAFSKLLLIERDGFSLLFLQLVLADAFDVLRSSGCFGTAPYCARTPFPLLLVFED
jgi:hypothetical protein